MRIGRLIVVVAIGAKARVGGSISTQFGGALSLQDRSAFELRDYPQKETLVGTLFLRRGVNPARVVLCREVVQVSRTPRRIGWDARGITGVREAPRHEIAGAVRGWFRLRYGELAPV